MSSLEADPIHRVPRLLRFRDEQANDLALCVDGTAATLQQLARALSRAALALAEGEIEAHHAAAVLAEHGKLLAAISQTLARRSETTRREWSLKEQEERT
jgi:hypothetical protein